jgi:transketolase
MESVTKKEIIQWSRLGQRAMFGQFMLKIAETNDNLMVISADLGRSSGLDRFKKQFPEKYLSVGISEQNMIGVAAGMAKEGHKVFVTSFAPFISMRACEQIRMNLGYMELDVNLVALGSGLSMGYLGNSHYGLEDIAIMRSIPNLSIHSPADCSELREMIADISSNERGPNYIRLTGTPGMPAAYDEAYQYNFGIPVQMNAGTDILVLALGSMVAQCQIAVDLLHKQNISAELLNVKTVKPIHSDLMAKIHSFKKIVTVEEHTVIGGLYSTVAEIVGVLKDHKQIKPIALPDQFGPTGTHKYLLDHYGLTGEKIALKIRDFAKQK